MKRPCVSHGCGVALWLLGGTLLMGCGSSPPAQPVNTALAMQSLQRTLDAWKAGAHPSDLRKSSPEIIAQDMAWMENRTLVRYEITGAGQRMDANLCVPVQLVLGTPSGQRESHDVVYIVGTDPVITVFRQMF